MSVNEYLAHRLWFPLHEYLRGRSTAVQWRELRQNEKLSLVEYETLRLKKLRALLAHCMQSVPYYRECLREVGLTDVRDFTLDNLKELPVLDRNIIRSQGDELNAVGWDKQLIAYSTGGSTGHPLTFYTDRHRESCLNAQKLRARSWFGVYPGDRQVDFWGSPIEMSRQSRIRKLKDKWFLNQVVLSASNLTNERIENYVSFIRDYKPRLIYGYATVIYRTAKYINENQAVIGNYRPKLVACTSEMLYPHMKEMIKKVFQCPVANEYGSRDGGLIAHECPKGELHILGEQVIVEVDDVDDSGVGDLLVTNLDGYGMPFIRYRIGDRGSLKNGYCGCGLALPLMGKIEGRSNDFMVGKNGKLIHNSSADYVLRKVDAFRQYQLRQRPDHGFDIYMVVSRKLTIKEKTEIAEGLSRVLGEQIDVNFKSCESIAPEKSGKYRWLISEALT